MVVIRVLIVLLLLKISVNINVKLPNVHVQMGLVMKQIATVSVVRPVSMVLNVIIHAYANLEPVLMD